MLSVRMRKPIRSFGINMGPCSDPVTAVRVAQAAEAAGFESVWTGEHIVLPDPQAPASPVPHGIGHRSRRRLAQHLDPKSPLLDPAVSLAFVAAHTQRVKLGTGIIILPQRNPLVLAKELASVDVVSGGRLIFGLGVGFLKAEFDALGIPFTHKGERTIEYLQAMSRSGRRTSRSTTVGSSRFAVSRRGRGPRSRPIRRSSTADTRPRPSGARSAMRRAGTDSRSMSTRRRAASAVSSRRHAISAVRAVSQGSRSASRRRSASTRTRCAAMPTSASGA
jgi:alkanesulfonate monooxygenase SsuD/methylene tetrahydromethanopterin reductase-like flavin-dependent oxidoreductase (luciferase family)